MYEVCGDTREHIERVIKKALLNKELAGLNMMVVSEGKEVFYHEAGLANVEEATMIRRDSIFRLYSMSKPITAAAVMILMERGQIDLFDSVSKYVPEFTGQMVVDGKSVVPVKRDVTIKDLLNMTSGIPYPGEDESGQSVARVFEALDERLFSEKPMTTIEFAQKIGNTKLKFQPGDGWDYGASADVLGAIVALVSGKSFRDFLLEELFEPLGMVDTDFFVPVSKQDRVATVYETSAQKTLEVYEGNNLGIMNKMEKVPDFQSGGAGLVGTIDDYGKFAQMLQNGGGLNGVRVLKGKTVEFMTSQVLDTIQMQGYRNWHTLVGHSYGNLMRVVTKPELTGFIVSQGEYGWDGWLGCYFANLPKEKLTILIMMQKKDAGTTDLTRKLRNVILS